MSVSIKRLVELASKPTSQGELQAAITKQLSIDERQLAAFLKASEAGLIDLKQEALPRTVILEVSYALEDAQPIWLKPQESRYEVAGRYQYGRKIKYDGELEALRIRLRLADVDSFKEPVFKLGFPVVIPRVSIDVSRVKGAGQDALFDYYVHWFNNAQYNSEPSLATWAQELSVPPVVFLHQ